jgi:thymidylate synthase (FAD)
MTHQNDVIGDSKYLPLLDHGFLGIVDHMGTDSSIVQAARVSYGAGTKKVNEDRALIRYLLRMQHSTPLEMCEVKLHVKTPIFVARQWVRHRTSSTNEQSFRYSEIEDEFYLPDIDNIQPQSSDNKQGRAGSLSKKDAEGVQWMMEGAYEHAFQSYKVLLGDRIGKDPSRPGFDVLYDAFDEYDPMFTTEYNGIAREIARAVMPVGGYTEFYWKLNLWNLMRFLNLRLDLHAQYEIRVYAQAIVELVRPLFPIAMEAFDDYIHGAATLSRMETEILTDIANSNDSFKNSFKSMLDQHDSMKAFAQSRGMSLREITDFIKKFGL